MIRLHSGPTRTSRSALLVFAVVLALAPRILLAGTVPVRVIVPSLPPFGFMSGEPDVWGLDWMLEPPDLLYSQVEDKIRVYMDATAKGMDSRVRTTLPLINGLPRQLLALKYYLARSRREIRAKWAWTPAQEKRFKKSAEYQTVIAEVEKVRAKFAELNPGYALRVSVELRDVREQVASWNEMPSVEGAAGLLMNACTTTMADTIYAPLPTPPALERFRQFLARFRLSIVPTVAVPGLSAHGQLKAFDFVVIKGDKVIAGTETATIRNVWERPGWTAKLKDAVKQSGAKFEGPLASPREPWHYSYKP